MRLRANTAGGLIYHGRLLVYLRLLALLSVVPLWGQTETGHIRGIVIDPAGNAVPHAKVSALSRGTGASRTVFSSRSGTYIIADLLPGSYELSVGAPGRGVSSRSVNVASGAFVEENFRLGTAATNGRLKFTDSKANDYSFDGQSIGEDQVLKLPNLTRNPYQFAQLSGNISDAGTGTRGAGFAIHGQREDSTAILVDGASNRDEFAGAIGQPIPLDAVREAEVLSDGMTAEYGRASGGVVSVATKAGTNDFHGTAYEYNRVSRLSSNTFKENANGLPEPAFERNQFGLAATGSLIRTKLFYSAVNEGLLVRSTGSSFAWIPSPELLAQTPSNTQAFFGSLGQLRADAKRIGTVTLRDLTAIYGKSPCTGLACATLPAGLPLFRRVTYPAPLIAAGGYPQNTFDGSERLDYNLSSRTWLYGRYAIYREQDQTGVLSSSPYSDYDLGQTQLDHTITASATHIWNTSTTSQSRITLNRFRLTQQGLTARGVVPTMYANPISSVTISNDNIAFPGYSPFAPGSGGAFGGPQNYLQAAHNVSWVRRSHLLRFGGSYYYIRDNRTDAAFQTAVDSLSTSPGLGPAVNGLLSGQFARIEVAVNPQGKFPCHGGQVTPACSLTLPVSSPDFSRSNRFHEGALYVQDYWRASARLSLHIGLRWEHFGVQREKNALDSNWYAPGIGFADDNLGAYLRRGGLQLASQSPVGGLWRPDWKDFAPRVGAAYDLFGQGRTVLRAGYGIGYERNFGNVTFNVIQNLPNYAVVHTSGPITTDNFGLPGNNGTLALPLTGARIIDPDLKTAYAHFWHASVQHELATGIFYTLEYSGSKGVNLYTISYPNQIGFGNFALGDPCTAVCNSQPNPNYSEDVGYRGNQGFSHYYGINQRVAVTDLFRTGISFAVNYTWAKAIDNMSSVFFESGGLGVAGQYGSQNVTINNGLFDTGLLDPYHPRIDRGYADFDVRHRVVLSGMWTVPTPKQRGWRRSLLSGWSLSPLLLMRSGQPFSVFDTSAQTLDLSAPRATFAQPVPTKKNTFVASSTLPDVFQLITFLPAQIAREPNPLFPGSSWPANMSQRNSFRAPGFWNLDLAIHQERRISERVTLQLRGEFFNVFNHANLYIIGATANVGSSNTVDGCYGCTGGVYDRRQVQLAARVIF